MLAWAKGNETFTWLVHFLCYFSAFFVDFLLKLSLLLYWKAKILKYCETNDRFFHIRCGYCFESVNISKDTWKFDCFNKEFEAFSRLCLLLLPQSLHRPNLNSLYCVFLANACAFRFREVRTGNRQKERGRKVKVCFSLIRGT